MKECVNNDQLFGQSPGAVFNSQKTFFRHKIFNSKYFTVLMVSHQGNL